MSHSYQIDPRPPELGGGWKLKLLEDGEEVGGGVFPAGDDGYGDALETAEDWIFNLDF
jgi:hypothetical protein